MKLSSPHRMERVSEPRDIIRFGQYVKLSRNGDCWEWTGHKNGKGYGQFWLGGRMFWSHRVSYAMFVGEIEEGMHVHHTCGNPACVRPGHLKQMEMEENSVNHRYQDESEPPF